jgi:cytochrome b561
MTFNLARVLAIIAAIFLPLSTAVAANWTVMPARSEIGFSGTHAGVPFQGRFAEWSADITFDPDALDKATATVRVDLTSASTGNATYDKSLPTTDWFDIASSKTAVFQTSSIRKLDATTYRADGVLSMRGKQIPVTLKFALEIEGEIATMTGKSTLARLDFGIGAVSDATGAWVSLEIPLDIKVVARRGSP